MKVFNKIKQGLTFHKANKNYFQNIVFSKDIKSQNSIFFINSKDLLENSEYENWRQKYPIQSEEFKKSGMTIINNNKKTFLISNNTKERKQLIKNINSSISTLMALNCKSVQINFSKGIFCNKEKGFILNQLYSSNYIPNENNFSRLQREKYKKQIVPSTIKELRVFQDETMEKNKNKIELGIILGKA